MNLFKFFGSTTNVVVISNAGYMEQGYKDKGEKTIKIIVYILKASIFDYNRVDYTRSVLNLRPLVFCTDKTSSILFYRNNGITNFLLHQL